MSTALETPEASQAQLLADLASKAEKLTNVVSSIKNDPQTKAARSGAALAPHARRGEDPLTSRGFSFLKLFGVIGRKVAPENAKVEVQLHNKLQKELIERMGYTRMEANTVLAPFGSEFFPCDNESELALAREARDLIKAGVMGYDPEEIRDIRRKLMGGSYRAKTLSWTDETAMGALVEPPLMGELIEIFRNNEVFLAAGARTMGLPPMGRIVYPRQTAQSQAFYVGENQQGTSSQPATGDIILQAKKLMTIIKVPNELFRYASVSVEMFLRQDMTKVMGLAMDKTLLEGAGSSNSPKGLINYAGITTYTSTGTPADGNSGYPLQPEDIYKIIANVEEQNAVFRAWVMKPLEYAYICNERADAVSAGDKKGPFMFNVWRELQDHFDLERTSVGNLSGYPVHKSTQISGTRTRGSGTTNNTYILGGDFTDYIVAIAPTIEFAMTQQGDTAFQNDQTWIRAILPHDGAPRHEASFVLCDNLLY